MFRAFDDGVSFRYRIPRQQGIESLLITDELTEFVLTGDHTEPSVLEDTSWIQPNQYMGIWWGMHIGKYTFFEGERHGATTENAKRRPGDPVPRRRLGDRRRQALVVQLG